MTGAVPSLLVTIGGMLIGVVACALLLAILRMAGMGEIIAWLAVGPGLGAFVQKWRGGRGILGGLVGGILTYVGFGVAMYVHASLNPHPSTVDYLGPELSLLPLASLGALVGTGVGFLVRGVTSIQRAWSKP
jgi:hypothetical protein